MRHAVEIHLPAGGDGAAAGFEHRTGHAQPPRAGIVSFVLLLRIVVLRNFGGFAMVTAANVRGRGLGVGTRHDGIGFNLAVFQQLFHLHVPLRMPLGIQIHAGKLCPPAQHFAMTLPLGSAGLVAEGPVAIRRGLKRNRIDAHDQRGRALSDRPAEQIIRLHRRRDGCIGQPDAVGAFSCPFFRRRVDVHAHLHALRHEVLDLKRDRAKEFR